ncbi:hypothetical protein Ksed_10080 [Kytococcus sedentarius DSM 20547]|uniref:Uncharacterized protein n=1 Tax=Kytococcus sedentarius (strain ATCC 14392 / DSM 20547 / JCM 11482 / CCUG 33030 / NBRC 15357 / NCTC 11040 / CCM 314 / 541) TaxID=478801 RepID=C7NGE5_KYTSD|nr:hypothetical protein Ksed_10080 [Kytococcus sedentarius DSM 20547]
MGRKCLGKTIQMVLDDVFHEMGVDAEVLVDHDVPEAGDGSPGNLWGGVLGFLRECPDGLADDG